MLLTTKITLPHPKAGTIRRDRLLTQLGNNLDKKLVLITSDAGYGKTTLLAQLIKESHLPCVFYDLDKGDSDLMLFYMYLVNGIKQIDPILVKYSEGLLKSAKAHGEIAKNVELPFGTLINELHEKRKKELFVILDNYHNIAEDSVVHRALDFFIDRLPENTRVIISSRSVPPLPSLARWRAKQELFELSREDLAFTAEEIAALLKDVCKTSLSEEDVRQITAHTEGWVTGVRLILQPDNRGEKTIQQRIHDQLEANKPLYEFFVNDILSGESKALQDFLIKCSILSVMTPAACNAILEVNDSDQVLINLEQRHLFITTAGEGEYKYHHLFREFLQRRLNDEQTSLHRKAADYYKQQGNAELSVEHYLEAGDFRKAGALICINAGKMMMTAQFAILNNWFQRMPEDSFIKQPELFLHIVSLRRTQGRLDEAEVKCNQAIPLLKKIGNGQTLALALLEKAKLLWSNYDHVRALTVLRQAQTVIRDRRLAKRFNTLMKGEIFILSALLWTEIGDYCKAKDYYLRARRIRELVKNSITDYIVESNRAMLYVLQGEEQLAYDVYHALITQIGEKYFHKSGSIFANAAISSISRGNVAWAEQTLDQGRTLCKPYDDAWSKAYLHYGYGYLSLQKAQWETALHHLGKAADIAVDLGHTILRCMALRDFSRVYRYQGDFSKAQESLDQALSASGGKIGQLQAGLQIEQGLIQCCQGDFEKAERTIKGCLAQSRKLGWGRMAFMSLLAGAAVSAEQGKTKPAILRLRQAVQFAKSKGYDGILLRELRASPRLAALAQRAKVEPVYLGRILPDWKTTAQESEIILLKARLLGCFELSSTGVSQNARMNRKTSKAVLSFILLHPKNSFTWENIAAWAWPDSPPKSAHHMFRRAICDIHRSFPAFKTLLRYKGNMYSLTDQGRIWVDVLEFGNLLEKAASDPDELQKYGLLEQAVDLYRGPLLPDYYYTWINDLRNQLEGKYTAALGALAQWHFDKQRYEISAQMCHMYLQTDELDESIHHLLVAIHICQGRKSQAIKQYKILVKMLHKNYGTRPSPETVSLIKSLH